MAKQQNNGNKRNTKYYLRSNVRTLAIKCYEEQMPEGWESVKIKIKQIDKKYLIVIAIKHDRDPDGDNFWAPSTEKPHYHIIVRVVPPAPPVKKPPRLKPTKEEKFKKHCEKANDECGRVYGALQRMLPREEQLNHQSIRDKFRELYTEYSDVPDECFDEMFL